MMIQEFFIWSLFLYHKMPRYYITGIKMFFSSDHPKIKNCIYKLGHEDELLGKYPIQICHTVLYCTVIQIPNTSINLWHLMKLNPKPVKCLFVQRCKKICNLLILQYKTSWTMMFMLKEQCHENSLILHQKALTNFKLSSSLLSEHPVFCCSDRC